MMLIPFGLITIRFISLQFNGNGVPEIPSKRLAVNQRSRRLISKRIVLSIFGNMSLVFFFSPFN
jgi:hypothetical protein